jgi:hypothetical protein
MTTQEKFDLIPAHYLPQFLTDEKIMISIQIPHRVGIDIETATIINNQNSVEIRIDNTLLILSKQIKFVTINSL